MAKVEDEAEQNADEFKPQREIQIEMFPLNCEGTSKPKLELMRPHKWAHSGMSEVALASIEVVEHAPLGWMWATCLNSKNGSSQGAKALPKWGKFAPTRSDAIQSAVDEVRAFMHRATKDEQAQIIEWLGLVLSPSL